MVMVQSTALAESQAADLLLDVETKSTIDERPSRSWIFRLGDWVGVNCARIFGIASVIFILAVISNIPILQLLAFGYLLEVSGRLGRREPLRTSFVGISKATKIGSVALGAWLLLWPIRLVSKLWLDAYIIDPTSAQQRFLAISQFVLILLIVAHVASAIICGGKLRYFFWPLVAPFSFGIWFVRRFAGSRFFRRFLEISLGWMSPHLVDDLCNARPLTDWFLPAILWQKIRRGTLVAEARDGLWEFLASLRLPHYLMLGLKGLVGSVVWLAIPTVMLINATQDNGPGPAMLGIFGSLLAVPVFSLLPFVQVHFATDGKLSRFIEVRKVLQNMGRAPLSHLLALLLTLTFALPLFLLKIERIPSELMWTLSLFFVSFALPARWICGWAYRRGASGASSKRWWFRYPVWSLLLLVSFVFVFIMFFTRYITWNGAFSLLENHVFLIPAPFWLGR